MHALHTIDVHAWLLLDTYLYIINCDAGRSEGVSAASASERKETHSLELTRLNWKIRGCRIVSAVTDIRKQEGGGGGGRGRYIGSLHRRAEAGPGAGRRAGVMASHLPVKLILVDQGEHAERLELIHSTTFELPAADLHYVRRIVVSLNDAMHDILVSRITVITACPPLPC